MLDIVLHVKVVLVFAVIHELGLNARHKEPLFIALGNLILPLLKLDHLFDHRKAIGRLLFWHLNWVSFVVQGRVGVRAANHALPKAFLSEPLAFLLHLLADDFLYLLTSQSVRGVVFIFRTITLSKRVITVVT